MPHEEDDNDIMGLIDPDNNHFNNYAVNFTSHSIDSFVRNSNINNNSLNIMHHNSRSIMHDGRLGEYETFLKLLITHLKF